MAKVARTQIFAIAVGSLICGCMFTDPLSDPAFRRRMEKSCISNAHERLASCIESRQSRCREAFDERVKGCAQQWAMEGESYGESQKAKAHRLAQASPVR